MASNCRSAYHHNPPPGKGQQVVLFMVQESLEERARAGYEKYGTLLTTHNGRDPLWDAYEEALDLVMYLAQAILEKDGKKEEKIEEEELEEDEFIRLLIPRKRR